MDERNWAWGFCCSVDAPMEGYSEMTHLQSAQADMEAALAKLTAIADELNQMCRHVRLIIEAKSAGPKPACNSNSRR